VVRFANSGSEATQVAIRLARAHTGRWKVLKFAGHFHGLHDHILYSAHPPRHAPEQGILIETIPESAGMPPALAELVVVAQWNDEASVERAFREHGADLAAVICEPINYNSGCIPPRPGFLGFLREISRRYGTLLLFDEVLSGFRTGVACAQGTYGVTPDVCLLAKAVANGVPLAVVAGRRDVMRTLAPEGDAAHSGTYSGHAFGVMAALATLDVLAGPGFYDGPAGIFAVAERLYGGLREVFARRGIRCRVQGLGARFGLYFGVDPGEEVWQYNQVAAHDAPALVRFIGRCLERGLYFHGYEMALGHHGFSAAHTLADVDWALDRIDDACGGLA
jgi:glutamate-1-semialdehyde 2,1-aminomutase